MTKGFLVFLVCISLASVTVAQEGTADMNKYVCLPCGSSCDLKVYNAPGKCEECGMELVRQFTVIHKEVTLTDVCAFVASHPGLIIIDVRSREEFDGKSGPDYGKLRGAVNVPIQDFEKRTEELRKYKNKEVLVYCSHSRRSPRAAWMLTQMGFRKVFNMSTGISEMTDTTCKQN